MTQYQQPGPAQYAPQPPQKKSNTLKILLIIFGVLGGLTFCCCGGIIVWAMSLPEGGVRTANNMESYATEYIADNKLLEPGEKLVMYYDESDLMNGSESVILTDRRLIYHTPTGNTIMKASEVIEVTHGEAIFAEAITVKDTQGNYISFEVFIGDKEDLFIGTLEDLVKRNTAGSGTGDADGESDE